jgi:hypothetical protein
MNIEPENTISLYEVLVKTSYQTQITVPDDKKCANPVAFGSPARARIPSRSYIIFSKLINTK